MLTKAAEVCTLSEMKMLWPRLLPPSAEVDTLFLMDRCRSYHRTLTPSGLAQAAPPLVQRSIHCS